MSKLIHIKAVIGADIALDTIVADVNTIKPTANSFAFLVDSNGDIIANANKALTMKPVSDLIPALSKQKVIDAQRNNQTIAVQFNQRDGILYAEKIK